VVGAQKEEGSCEWRENCDERKFVGDETERAVYWKGVFDEQIGVGKKESNFAFSWQSTDIVGRTKTPNILNAMCVSHHLLDVFTIMLFFYQAQEL
jgi:hypothetical protein